MRSLVFLTTLITIVAAAQENFSLSCQNIALSSSGGLTATCNDKNHVAKSASLDLNTVVGLTSNPTALKFHYTYSGPPAGFTPPCTNCALQTKPDPIYGGPVLWMHCLCGGVTAEINLDDSIGNDDGTLKVE